MSETHIKRIICQTENLTHADVLEIGRQIEQAPASPVVVIDLRRTCETTTAALATLIVLRHRQIKAGGDLLLIGLSGKAQYLYELLRLAKVLPRRPCISPRRVRQQTTGRGGSTSSPARRRLEQLLANEPCMTGGA